MFNRYCPRTLNAKIGYAEDSCQSIAPQSHYYCTSARWLGFALEGLHDWCVCVWERIIFLACNNIPACRGWDGLIPQQSMSDREPTLTVILTPAATKQKSSSVARNPTLLGHICFVLCCGVSASIILACELLISSGDWLSEILNNQSTGTHQNGNRITGLTAEQIL